jgi:hypothetical protein
MTTFFDATQRRILKYTWIPIIVYLFFDLLSDLHLQDYYTNHRTGNDYLTSVLSLSPYIICVGYEFFIRKKYREMVFMMLAAVAVNVLIILSFYYRTKTAGPGYGVAALLISMLGNFLLMVLRGYLLGRNQILQGALIAMGITFFSAALGSNINYFVTHFMGFWWKAAITLPFRSLYPLLYFTGLLLADNLSADKGYLEKLKSKIQIIGGREYLVLYVALIATAFFGAVTVGWSISTLYRKIFEHGGMETRYFSTAVLIIHSLGYAAISAAAGYLLRNIIVSRMMTIGSDNGWLYVLHFSLLLNIIPVIIFSRRNAAHKTEEENAYFYLAREFSSVGTFMMYLGAICAFLSGCYIMIAAAKYHQSSSYAMLFALFCFLSMIMHLLLKRFKDAVYWIISLNTLTVVLYTILLGDKEDYSGVMFLAIYLSFYVMMEVFHPSLDKYQLESGENPKEIPAV